MRVPILVVLAILFLGLKKGEEGCPAGINVSTSNGININSEYRLFNHCDSVQILSEDSISIILKGGNCCQLKFDKISLNGVQIPFVMKGPQVSCVNLEARILGKAGNYKVDATFNFAQKIVIFDMMLNAVGIKESSSADNRILVYPNPSSNILFLTSTSGNISLLEIFNDEGKKVSTYHPDKNSFEIPTPDFPAGIYFIQVTTLPGTTQVKRIVIL